MFKKPNILLAYIFCALSLGMAATPIKDLVLQSNMDASSFDIDNVGRITADSMQFTGGSTNQAILSWNVDEETLDLQENGTTLQLGQELHINAHNSTGSTISNGTLVAYSGTLGASSRIEVEPFLADGNTDMHLLLGIATEDIPNGDDGKVTHFGKVRSIDTSAWLEGTELYASATEAGGFTTNAPAAPAQAIVVAIVINQHSQNGNIEVIPNWIDENAGGSDTDWANEGAILRSTNDTVLVAGSGLAGNADQFIISNDVNGVVFSVDEDGDTGFRKWSSLSGAEDQSKLQFVSQLDFRFTLDYDLYFQIVGSTTERMDFNPNQSDLDFRFKGDNDENLLYIDTGEDSVSIHTNVPPAGYGFAVATNAYITGPITLETEGTATNHVVTKQYVDTAVAGAGGSDNDWSDEGAILRSTNDTVLVAGSGISANDYQFIVSNDVNGVVLAVDEDGDFVSRKGIFNKEPNTSADESGIAFVSGYDTRITTLSREYIRMEAAPLPNAMIFNDLKRDNDLYIYSDIASDTPFFLQGSDGAIAIHTDTPESGYGLTVSTNTIFTATGAVSAVVIEDVLQMEPRASAPTNSVTAGMIFYHSTSNKLFCYDGTTWQALF